MSGQVESSTRLMRVKQVDDVQAEVPLEPLDVGIGAVENLRRRIGVHSTSRLVDLKIKRLGTRYVIFFHLDRFHRSFSCSSPHTTHFHRCPTACESRRLPHTPQGTRQLHQTCLKKLGGKTQVRLLSFKKLTFTTRAEIFFFWL